MIPRRGDLLEKGMATYSFKTNGREGPRNPSPVQQDSAVQCLLVSLCISTAPDSAISEVLQTLQNFSTELPPVTLFQYCSKHYCFLICVFPDIRNYFLLSIVMTQPES